MLLNCGVLESPLDCKEIQPVHPKGDQSWVFIGRTDVEDEAPIFWLPDAKSWLTRKNPDAGKDRGQEEKGMTEDEMVGWNHRLNGHESGWTPGVGGGQGSLACCCSWGRKESDTTEQLNWTELNSAYKLSKQGDNIQAWHTPFLIWNQSLLSLEHSWLWHYNNLLLLFIHFYVFPICTKHMCLHCLKQRLVYKSHPIKSERKEGEKEG